MSGTWKENEKSFLEVVALESIVLPFEMQDTNVKLSLSAVLSDLEAFEMRKIRECKCRVSREWTMERIFYDGLLAK